MCEYCENEPRKSMTASFGRGLVLEGHYTLRSYVNRYYTDGSLCYKDYLGMFQINFCPMCGRDLRKENGK